MHVDLRGLQEVETDMNEVETDTRTHGGLNPREPQGGSLVEGHYSITN
jgi:hypothetical protein